MKTKHIIIGFCAAFLIFFAIVISVIGIGIALWSLDSPGQSAQEQSDTGSPSAYVATSKQDNEAASGLVGHWVKAAAVNSGNRNSSSGGWSSGSNVSYTFYEDGTYSYHYESFASIDVPGMGSLSSSEDKDAGQFSVSDGQISLESNTNGSNSLIFRVVDEKYIQIGNAYFVRQ